LRSSKQRSSTRYCELARDETFRESQRLPPNFGPRLLTDRLSFAVVNRHRDEYQRRVRRVVDYIDKHPAQQLSLARLARIAAFSPYHFHRVFRAVTGETVYDFSQRLRVEKAAQRLLASARLSVEAIARHCGFASGATLARAFKAHFGMTATRWRAGGWRRWRQRKPEQLSKPGKTGRRGDGDTVDAAPIVRIVTLPTYRVACMRYTGPYGAAGIPRLWERLRRWRAGALDESTAGKPNAICLGIAYDNPNIADPATCRYDACLPVSRSFKPHRQVGMQEVAGGRYAVYDFVGPPEALVATWDRIFGNWLPDSGFEADDKPCIELFRSTTGPDPSRRPIEAELCLPIRRLRRASKT
jgi:AraC family transcriptional regulator